MMSLAACTAKSPAPATSQTTNTSQDVPTTTQKKGDTVKTGKILQINSKFFIQEPGKPPADIDSYTVNLGSYVGQTVKITGEYSGDTLFVGKIEQQ